MTDNTNMRRQIEALPSVRYRRATLSDCESILALDPTFLNGMDYMPYRLPHYINDPNCVCGVMVTADDTVVAFHVFRIADEGRAVYAGGLRVRADHRRQGYPSILASNSERIVNNITRPRGQHPTVGRYTAAESPWNIEQIAKSPTRKVVDRRIVTVVESGQQSLINLLSSPVLAKQYAFNDVINLTSSTQAYDVLSRNSHLLSRDFFCCLLEPYQLLPSNIDYLSTVMNSVILATPLAASATGCRDDGGAADARGDVRGISTNVTFPCTAGIRHDCAYYGSPDASVIVQQLLYALVNSDKIMSRASSNNSSTPVFVWLLLPDDIECREQVINILCNQLGFSMPRGDGVKYLLVVEFPFENFTSKL